MLWWTPADNGTGALAAAASPGPGGSPPNFGEPHPGGARLFVSPSETQAFVATGAGAFDDLLLERWARGRQASDEGPEEYAEARRMLCLHPDLLRRSRVGEALMHVKQCRRLDGRSPFDGSAEDILMDFHDVFEPSLLLAIKKAFGHRFDIAARNEDRSIPVVAAQPGNLYDAAVKMWAALPIWKKPIMSAALRELLVTEDATGLQVVLGMMRESLQHCSAAKVDVWSRVLLRVSAPAPEPCGGALRSASAEAHRRLWEASFAFADEWKEKALTTVFLEPTKMYYAASGDHRLVENVEVHGASVYLAVLMSTLGVSCPRLPFMLDAPFAAVSFLDALDADQMAELWLEEHFGKPYQAVPGCRRPRAHTAIAHHECNFIFHGVQAWLVANNAIEREGLRERRERLRPYLEKFASCFSLEVLVPRLSQHLLASDDTRAALQVVLDELRGEAAGGDAEADVRYWLWDLEAVPARLRVSRATRLLERAGLLRPGAGHGAASPAPRGAEEPAEPADGDVAGCCHRRKPDWAQLRARP